MAKNEFSAIDPELAAILAELKAEINVGSKAGSVTFLKAGEHFIKFVYPEGRSLRHFMQSYINTYEGKEFTYFVVAGVIVGSDQEDIVDRTKVKFIKATKTMVNGILSAVSGEWPVFADEGPVIKVRIYKDGTQTKYEVTPITKKFDSSMCPYPEISIEEAAKDQEEYSAKKSEDPLAFTLPATSTKKEVITEY